MGVYSRVEKGAAVNQRNQTCPKTHPISLKKPPTQLTLKLAKVIGIALVAKVPGSLSAMAHTREAHSFPRNTKRKNQKLSTFAAAKITQAG